MIDAPGNLQSLRAQTFCKGGIDGAKRRWREAAGVERTAAAVRALRLDDRGVLRGRGRFGERADRQVGALAQFIEALDRFDPERLGVSTAQIVQAITPDAAGNVVSHELRTAVAELCPTPGDKTPGTGSLGKRIGNVASQRAHALDSRKRRRSSRRALRSGDTIRPRRHSSVDRLAEVHGRYRPQRQRVTAQSN